MRKHMRFGSFAFLCFCLLFLPSIALAQVKATIVGIVTDPSGAVIPGVKITVTNTDTSVARALETNAAGSYVAPELAPGHYEVKAEAKGFSPYSKSGIVLNVNDTVRVDISMLIGEVAERVTVSEAAVKVQTESGEVTDLISATQLSQLPVNTRSFFVLATLTTGVSSAMPDFTLPIPVGGDSSIRFNGNRNYHSLQVNLRTENHHGFTFQDASLPIDQRVNDLVSRMTLEEKVSQMRDHAVAIPRLSVPKYDWWNEGLHGVAFAGYATNFPQVIGMAATWDTGLVHRMGDTVSTEARAKYNEAMRHDQHEAFFGLTFWAPNINIFRDPRWGRGQETYGEDPFLSSRLPVKLAGFSGGDRTSIDLPASQEDLLKALAATGKPLVVVLQNGSALAVNWAQEHAAANLEAWYPGEEGGTAIAETLAGTNNPGRRLPVAFYAGLDQLPPFDDYSMDKRTYRYFQGKSLYGFGYGLSYSTFEYSDLKLSSSQLKAGDDLTVEVDVRNASGPAGDEVAELYLEFPALRCVPCGDSSGCT